MKQSNPPLEFPVARRDPESGYISHGRRFEDPYAWMERLDQPETQAWAATRTRRQTAFDDYIAAARWLVSNGYTTPSRLVSRGNSNGGLLVAVAAMQAPEAFGAVYCRAPILDLLRFPEFSHLGSAIVEYGSPDDPVEGAYLAAYSPYHNVRVDRRYPVMAFVSALNDRNAPPYDPLEMIAKLETEATAGGPYLFLPLHDSGHGGGATWTALIE